MKHSINVNGNSVELSYTQKFNDHSSRKYILNILRQSCQRVMSSGKLSFINSKEVISKMITILKKWSSKICTQHEWYTYLLKIIVYTNPMYLIKMSSEVSPLSQIVNSACLRVHWICSLFCFRILWFHIYYIYLLYNANVS